MINARKYILSKQIAWARRNNITLVGSKNDRGLHCYTKVIDDNLFEPLLTEVKDEFNKGDGHELKSSNGYPAKVNALHSSSALSINIFHYWKRLNKLDIISTACGLCNSTNQSQLKLNFEKKFSISKEFSTAPNIDVVIENNENNQYKYYAIECKFTEAYSKRQLKSGLDDKYFSSELEVLWKRIPNLRKLASELSDNKIEFLNFYPEQLIKHILGLLKNCDGKNFRLLYLWYDVIGEDGHNHRKEIEKFSKYTFEDGIKFSAISYQELIIKLSENNLEGNEAYIKYITDRYL